MSDDEQTQLIEDIKAIAKGNSDGTSPTPVLEMASALAGMFQRAEKPHQALRVYREIADALAESEGNTNDAVIAILRATADMLETGLKLRGTPIVVDGKLMSNAVSPTIQELMQERIKMLQRAVDIWEAFSPDGTANDSRFYEAQSALTEALVETARSREERIELLQQHCKTLEGSLLIAEKYVERGSGNAVDVADARARLLQAQIRLLQAQAPAAEKPHSKGTNEATGQAVPIVVRESDPEPICEVPRGQSHWSDAQAPDKNAVSPTIPELVQERIKMLQRAVDIREAQMSRGTADASRFYEAQNALTEALVETARSREERIELWQQHCKILEGSLLFAEEMLKGGAGTEVEATEARARLLQAQIRLLQAQAPAAERPRSKGTNEATGQAVPMEWGSHRFCQRCGGGRGGT